MKRRLTRSQVKAIKAKGYDVKNKKVVSFNVLGSKQLANGATMYYGLSPVDCSTKVSTIKSTKSFKN